MRNLLARRPATMLAAVAVALLATARGAGAGYDTAESDITKIIPLFEYKQLMYEQLRSQGMTPGGARDLARASHWMETSTAIRTDVYPLTRAKIVLINY